GVEELGEAPLALAHRRLGPYPVGDVDERGQNARSPVDDDDVGVGDGDDLAPVLAPESGLDVADRTPGLELRQSRLTLPGIDPDGDIRYGAADDLLSREAGREEERVIDFDDPAVIEAGDGEDGRAQLEDRLESRGPRGVHHGQGSLPGGGDSGLHD